VVQNLKDKHWDQYRSNFRQGTLWKWKTCDWGNVCLIDYVQIGDHLEDFQNPDLNFIAKEFAAILWSLPKENFQSKIKTTRKNILKEISSITFIVESGKTTLKELKEAESYYQWFEVPVKGILKKGVG
jgi:hypothetical protein